MDGAHRSIPPRASLSSTDSLVFRVLRLRFLPEERIAVGNEVASLDAEDLQVALRRARRLEVGPLFARELLSLDPVPAPVRAAAAAIYRENLARNLYLKAETDSWVAALRKVAIPCRVLKGVYLSELLYDDLGAKSCADIDLLVRRKDLDRAMTVASGRGFRLADRTAGDPDDPGAKAHTLESSRERPVPYSVDLHWDLEVPAVISLGQEGFWLDSGGQAGEETRTGDARDEPADLLGAFLCLHLWRHNMSVKTLIDFAAFVSRNDEAIPAISARFRDIRARDGVVLALILVARLFGTSSRYLEKNHPKRVFLPWLESCTHLSAEAQGRYLRVLVSPLRFEGFLRPVAATARYLFRSGHFDDRPRLHARATRFAAALTRASGAGPLFTHRKVDRARLV